MHDPSAGIKVSVSIITYNHEEYIAEAIDSVLAQEHNYPMEIIIGDDHSTDRTPEILKKYQRKYPDLIHLILHPRDYDDIPGRINNTTNLLNCRGKYIAMLDGDDYWNSPDKLAKQIAFLDGHPDYELVAHDCQVVYQHLDKQNRLYSERFDQMNVSRVVAFEELCSRPLFLPSTCVFRNRDLPVLQNWFKVIYEADIALMLEKARQGKCYYLDDVMSVWRRHNQAFSTVFSTTFSQINTRIQTQKIFRDNFNGYKQHGRFHTKMKNLYRKKIEIAARDKNTYHRLKNYCRYYLHRVQCRFE